MCEIIFVKNRYAGAKEPPHVSVAVTVGLDSPPFPLVAVIKYGVPGQPTQEFGFVGTYCDLESRKLKLIIDASNDLSCVHSGTIVPIP